MLDRRGVQFAMLFLVRKIDFIFSAHLVCSNMPSNVSSDRRRHPFKAYPAESMSDCACETVAAAAKNAAAEMQERMSVSLTRDLYAAQYGLLPSAARLTVWCSPGIVASRWGYAVGASISRLRAEGGGGGVFVTFQMRNRSHGPSARACHAEHPTRP